MLLSGEVYCEKDLCGSDYFAAYYDFQGSKKNLVSYFKFAITQQALNKILVLFTGESYVLFAELITLQLGS